MAVVTAIHDSRRRVIAASDPAATALGLRPGLAMAQALALVPGLRVEEADPPADAEALRRLALWCHRLTPLVGLDGTDGLWLDIAGASHLWDGEAAMLRRLLRRLARDGIHARAAVADTPGAAHAIARHGPDESAVVPPGDQGAALAGLPVAALRLAPELDATLRRLGFETIGHLARIPRALLARRFGPLPVLRLDQAYGRVQEPLLPLAAEPAWERRATFLEPLLTADALAIAIDHLTGPLCTALEHEGLGARQLDLLFERVDGAVQAVRIGTARPSRDAAHLARLLRERLDTVDPGEGVEAMRLLVPLAEPLRWEQASEGAADVARLVDRLSNRLGPGRVYRAAPVETDVPERAVRKAAALAPAPTPPTPERLTELPPLHLDDPKPDPGPGPAPPGPAPLTVMAGLDPAIHGTPHTPNLNGKVRSLPSPYKRSRVNGRISGHDEGAKIVAFPPSPDPLLADPPLHHWKPKWEKPPYAPRPGTWPRRLQAPARLLDPPRPITALAAMPHDPPVAFTWRSHRHKVRRADGPERIHGEWWQQDDETDAVRDYYQVEDETGRRFWLFRRGNGVDGRTGDLQWFVQGVF